MRVGLTRRQLLWGGAVAAGLGWLWPLGCAPRGVEAPVLARWLVDLIGDGRGTWEVGRAVLDRPSGRPDPGALAADLSRRLGLEGEQDEAKLREAYRNAVAGDFRAARMVTVDGWRLSETEAWAAALVALLIPTPETRLYAPPPGVTS